MWQKSKYFCFTSLKRLLKTVEEVDDLSNSDKVKSTVTGSESQMGTSGILLIAIPQHIFALFDNFLQCIPKESVADSLSALVFGIKHNIISWISWIGF